MTGPDLHSVHVNNLIPLRRPTALELLRKDDARFHRSTLASLSLSAESLGDNTQSLLRDMRSDGFHGACTPVALAVLRLRQAQRELEAAIGKVET